VRSLTPPPRLQALREASQQEGVRQQALLPDINAFIADVTVSELKQMRKLCSLTALTYKFSALTVRGGGAAALGGRAQRGMAPAALF
jgi:hypothetical protein